MDFFASHMVSLILSWIVCSFIFIGLIGYLAETFFEKAEDLPRVVTIWLSLCVIVLGGISRLRLGSRGVSLRGVSVHDRLDHESMHIQMFLDFAGIFLFSLACMHHK